MAFNIIGDAKELCFEPHFAAIQQFIHNTSETLGEDITLMRSAVDGHVLQINWLVTTGDRYLHDAWGHVRYWISRRDLVVPEFPANLVALSLQMPANPPEGVMRRG